MFCMVFLKVKVKHGLMLHDKKHCQARHLQASRDFAAFEMVPRHLHMSMATTKGLLEKLAER